MCLGAGRGTMRGAGAQRGAVFKLLSERPSYDRPLKKRPTAPRAPLLIVINIYTHKYKTNVGSTIYNNDMLILVEVVTLSIFLCGHRALGRDVGRRATPSPNLIPETPSYDRLLK